MSSLMRNARDASWYQFLPDKICMGIIESSSERQSCDLMDKCSKHMNTLVRNPS